MPIGKNAIQRVENNGYSKVESSAPDMENSTVIANLDKQVEEKMVAPVEKKTRGRKPAAKPAEAAPVEAKPVEEAQAEPKKPLAKRSCAKKAPAQNGFVRVEVGEKMPYYLL